MNEEPTREEVIEYFRHCIEFDNNFSMSIEVLEKAIEYIQQAPKYRKKAKRWKRKYMSLRSEVEKIRAEISAAEFPFDDPVYEAAYESGLQKAISIIDKHRAGGTR